MEDGGGGVGRRREAAGGGRGGGGVGWRGARREVRGRREVVGINRGFWGQLGRWEKVVRKSRRFAGDEMGVAGKWNCFT